MAEENNKKEWKGFIEDTIEKAVSKKLDRYTIPEGYITCKKCGTIYPEDCKCPKCSKPKGEINEIEDKQVIEERPTEDKPGEERPTEDKPGEERPTENRPGEDKPGEDKESETSKWHW